MVQRVAGLVEGDIHRQRHRQIRRRNRHDAAGIAMYDRDRTAPVALAAEAPVAQPEVHGALPGLRALDPVDDLRLRIRHGHTVEEARIDQQAVARVRRVADCKRGRIAV